MCLFAGSLLTLRQLKEVSHGYNTLLSSSPKNNSNLKLGGKLQKMLLVIILLHALDYTPILTLFSCLSELILSTRLLVNLHLPS